ncbi:hypothetical protein [Deinococcus puniceus]|uniref:DUF2946 domain-containing protein n=1 Tax=Deinococcus puniceus TaxID=1182568 RepID=A0A172T9J0_9DEIO|nr:hypothetical protein [Deinococcus puniceus]ANE43607.1 hypothetical protein SU48_07310 [Deinococcus puniceus]
MQRRRRHTAKRWWAALLTLVAAFAFPVRGPLLSPHPVSAGPQVQHGAAPAHPHGPPAEATAHAAHVERSESPTSPHQHSQAHCLFCLTGAFALTADSAAPPPAPIVHLAPALPVVVQPRAAALTHTDARAPPPAPELRQHSRV